MQGAGKNLSFTIILMIWLSVVGLGAPYRILVAPYFAGFSSHLLNMQKMADMLAQDGHQVSVLVNNGVRDSITTKHADIISFDVSEDVPTLNDLTIAELNMDGFSYIDVVNKIILSQIIFCETLFKDEVTMNSLREAKFDLILADTISMCNFGLVGHLNITTIWSQNVGFFYESEGFFPLFPSFNCHAAGVFCLSDDMTFVERALNTIFVIAVNFLMFPHFQSKQLKLFEDTNLKLNTPVEDIIKDKVIIIPNIDYVLDTPRPTMPHIFTFSGLFYKKPEPLNPIFQEIMDRSSPHGVIIMSFGTRVPKFDSKTVEIFASVFGKLKQQVVWRYTGKKPKSLQDNTHLVEWLPQNDLLANPAVKLFITHCGISSTLESAYNGVPVIAMPLFADQPFNAMKLTHRAKTGIKLDCFTVSEEQLENGIEEVLTNPIYAENAKRASDIMSNQLVSPVQQFRHLVNSTITSGGSKHLFHPYAAKMSWITYFGLDVIFFLLTLVLIVLFVIIFMLKTVYRLLCGKTMKQKEL